MNFGFPSVKPNTSNGSKISLKEDKFGLPDPMLRGLPASKDKLECVHPLEESEKIYRENRLFMDMKTMQSIQGIHAPLKLSMELHAARKVGHLPFLPSSNLMYDTLTGRDDIIDFEDILNIEDFRDQMPRPHLVMEKLWG